MVKLVRNAWGSELILRDPNNNILDFNFIIKLHEVQNNEALRLGTKLKKTHIEWVKQKMKVNLAAQTLSNSVADALEFLRTDLKHPDFKDAGPTIQFIHIIDRAFDLLNSRSPFGRGCKCPLKKENYNHWKPIFIETINLLKRCKNKEGISMVSSRKKTAFVGLIISMKSVIGIYDKYVAAENSPLQYVLTYKLSQDHLELFFCSVRSQNGWNNNPTAYQFYNTYRRLLVHHEVRTSNGNCLSQDATSTLHVTTGKVTTCDIGIDDISYIRKYQLSVNNDKDDIIPVLPQLSVLTENIVAYISGFVVNMAKARLKCPTCILALEDILTAHVDDSCLLLLNRKNRGGLVKPCHDILRITKKVELAIRQMLAINNNKIPKENDFFNYFVLSVSLNLMNDNKYFKNLDNHTMNCSIEEQNHIMVLIKTLVSCYTKIRFFNIAKTQTESERGELVRKKLSRLVLFCNQ